MRIRGFFTLALLTVLLLATTLANQAGPLGPAAAYADDWSEEVPFRRIAPVMVSIPNLGVNADIFPVGEDEDGAMSNPPHPDAVAWWALGAGPGEVGNVVLAAHVNWDGRLRVFGRLHQLEPGDLVAVADEQLREFQYEVQWSTWVSAEGAPVEQIFGSSGVPELTLITCGGSFDPATRQYLDRLIVRAHQI